MPPLSGFREAVTPGAPAEEEGPPRLQVFARRLASCALQLRLVPSKADRGSSLPHFTAGTCGSSSRTGGSSSGRGSSSKCDGSSRPAAAAGTILRSTRGSVADRSASEAPIDHTAQSGKVRWSLWGVMLTHEIHQAVWL
jgi:hypothetical protein